MFFFNDTATTEIYTLSLHDALPICGAHQAAANRQDDGPHRGNAQHGVEGREHAQLERVPKGQAVGQADPTAMRSEEHTSELQSRQYLVCRLLLEKKKIE